MEADVKEDEWLASGEPEKMLEFLGDRASERRLRLFAAACCRRVWDTLTADAGRRAVEVAEGFADGAAGARALRAAQVAAAKATADYDPAAGLGEYRADAALTAAMNAAGKRASLRYAAECAADASEDGDAERVAQAVLLRDIFGNPFKRVVLDPPFRTSAVTAIATAMYESRDFGAAAILADALEEAGCQDGEILGHLRGPGPHVRGCYVVDLALGRE
jgi:hypothetical protein